MSETTVAPSATPVADSGTNAPQEGAAPAKVDDGPDFGAVLKSKPVVLKRRDGREERIDSLERLQHLASKGYGAEVELQQARKAQEEARQYREREERLKKDPRGTLRQLLGEQEFRQLAEQEALEAYEAELKMRQVPEHVQKELLEARAAKQEAERLKAEKAEYERQMQEQQQQAEREAAREHLMTVGVKALQSVGFAEKPPTSVILRMGPYIAEAMDMGVAEPEKAAAALLKEDMQRELVTLAKSYVAGGDGAGLTAMLGEDVVKLLLKHRLSKQPRGPTDTPRPVAVAPAPKAPEQPKSFGDTSRELREFLRQR